jgi:glycosyltransferase involved in cell wall biosynthesis
MGEADLIRAMDEADALIHFPEEEAFGLVVAEALARNLKVFAARIGGIPDILEGTNNSELFDNFDGLRCGIEAWLEGGCPASTGNPDLMRLRYAPKVVGERHLQIYREVLG